MEKYYKQASDFNCIRCNKKRASAFWPVFDVDIESKPYCSECLLEIKKEVLILMYEAEQINHCYNCGTPYKDTNACVKCPKCGERVGSCD